MMMLKKKTYSQTDFRYLFEKYKATKSVPPVDKLPFKATTIDIAERKPPNAIFKITSSNSGVKWKIFKNNEVKMKFKLEKKVNLGLIPR